MFHIQSLIFHRPVSTGNCMQRKYGFFFTVWWEKASCVAETEGQKLEKKRGHGTWGWRGQGQTTQVLPGPVKDWGPLPKRGEKPLMGAEWGQRHIIRSLWLQQFQRPRVARVTPGAHQGASAVVQPSDDGATSRDNDWHRGKTWAGDAFADWWACHWAGPPVEPSVQVIYIPSHFPLSKVGTGASRANNAP